MTQHNDTLPPVPWSVGDAVRATSLVLVSFVVVLVLFRLLASTIDVDDITDLTPWIFGVFEGLMLAFVWVFTVRKYRVGWHVLGLKRTGARSTYLLPFAALVGSLVFAAIYGGVITGLGLESLEPPPISDDAFGEGVTLTLNRIVIVFWGPFAEEVFFRGFLLAAFVAPFGRRKAVVISSAIFALAHIDPGTMLPIFVTGALLSWVYLRTRSLWPSVAAHTLQNLLVLTVATT